MKTMILTLAIAAGMALPALQANAQDAGADAPLTDRMAPEFGTLDTDGDGALTLAEMAAAAAARFDAADTDGDGGLSVAEIAARADARRMDGLAAMIADNDANGDGILQADEMQRGGRDRMARMFDRLDADDDGAVSAAEFAAARDHGHDRRGGHDGTRGGRDGKHHRGRG